MKEKMKLKSIIVVPKKNKRDLFSKVQSDKNTKSRVKKTLKRLRQGKAARITGKLTS
jgi:hypothetical protein